MKTFAAPWTFKGTHCKANKESDKAANPEQRPKSLKEWIAPKSVANLRQKRTQYRDRERDNYKCEQWHMRDSAYDSDLPAARFNST